MNRGLVTVVGSLVAAISLSGATTAQNGPALPEARPIEFAGGASAITETHGEWSVNCQVIRNTRLCSFSYQQFDKSSNQRVFGIELSARDGKAIGNLALPFGLALAKGVTLKVDDKPLDGSYGFSTCLIAGCLVPLSVDETMLGDLQGAATLGVSAFALDSGREVAFAIPLGGFTSAMNRTAQLVAD